jgi:pSer/pThr/pTyr-binding forkhead associated (FHA) protein
VTDGVDRGATLTLDPMQPSPMLVGTGPACGLRLTDREVSRRHAALEPTPDGLHLTDLASTNGTFANGVRVTDAQLGGGEVTGSGGRPFETTS